MSSVRILVVHPGAELYGADRVALESAAGLVEAGHDVIVALPEHGPLGSALRERGARVVVGPMFVLRKALLRPRNWPELISSAARGIRASSQLVSRYRPDVAYVSTVVLPLWPPMLRLRRVPTVSHIHEAESASPWVMRAVLYAPHLWSRTVVANSRFTADLVARTIPALQSRTRVIYNPIPGPAEAHAPRQTPSPIRLGYVGRLSPRKGPDAVVDAVAELRARGREARLEIVGDVFRGYEWYAANLDRRIADLGLADVVTRHGYDPDVWPYVAAADVMVVPSRTDESFGNTAVEAVLARRPVIVSDLPGLREAVAHHPTARVVAIGNAGAIADAVEEMVTDWPATARDTAPASAAASARHAPSAYHRSLVNAVESTAERRN